MPPIVACPPAFPSTPHFVTYVFRPFCYRSPQTGPTLQPAGGSGQKSRPWGETGRAVRQGKPAVVAVKDSDTEPPKLIEHASGWGAEAGVAVGGEDEAGPLQAAPPPGSNWPPACHPATQPPEAIRGGT